jgi:hypothetical protein
MLTIVVSYCKGLSGNWPDLFHRGAVRSGEQRRNEGGWMRPSRSRQPCRPSTNPNYNEDPAWTSMDEFPMALMVEGGRHGDWGPGFRCIDLLKNSGNLHPLKAL